MAQRGRPLSVREGTKTGAEAESIGSPHCCCLSIRAFSFLLSLQALERLQAKASREGIERLLQSRMVRGGMGRGRWENEPQLMLHSHCPSVLLLPLVPLSSLQRFTKPTLQRQKNRKEAVYNASKRKRVQLVEQMMLDPSIAPF